MEINVDPSEIKKFEALAHRWWDPNSEFKPLHQINPLRLSFIESIVSLDDKDILDVGCGGGILSESLSRKGARVVGIDMAEKALNVAKLHLHESRLNITYEKSSAEDFSAKYAGRFDVVTCMEMLEHVPDPISVVRACAELVKPGGWTIFSTISKTPKAFLFAIVGAEHILKLLPAGTHEYQKFIRPSILSQMIRKSGLKVEKTKGMRYNPITQVYSLTENLNVNYMLVARKLV
ncbi:MAG: bifunctional 2-polyprenyl-6-hydroxyphenol methylase/3-demethylubiquinol 3-O-methyltransferase UbiG [Proteobacteria bacterium]|nr:bifunctional 2-polyprenyl-6-hydroxyphenol methylase/3-demethylubiquinol 3-O-methyltransferase UbiG [Pseudomonadota bacterium]